MKIGSIGYNHVHDMKYENFIMDRPKGPGAVLLLLIKTPAVFKVGGVQYQVKENSFILMSADTPCYYTAQENVYTDDWVYFENDDWDKGYVEKLGIPMDIPVYLGDMDELSHLVHILVYEHYSGAVNSEEIEKRRIPVKVVQRCINAVIADLTGWKDIRYSTQENALTLSHESLGELNVDQLSDGIRNIFAVVADIAYRCLLLNPALGENAAQETSGIVLIDEVDMHLHPAWQQTILSDLRKAFPRIQFIVTTHSPQVLSSIETRHIRMLENGCCVPCEGSTYGAESSRILEEVFGISLRAKTASREALDTYLALIQQGEHDSQQARDLRAQLDKWLYGDPILDNADMLIRRAERQKAREPGRA